MLQKFLKMTTNLNSVDVNTPTRSELSVTDNCGIISWNTNTTWGSQSNLISQDVLEATNFVRSAIMIPVLFLIGFPGNVINMAVFFKQGLRERINLCLFSLALVDVIYISFLFIYNAERIMPGNLETKRIVVYMVNNNVIGLYGLTSASALISTIISVERCVVVLFPLRAQRCIPTKALGVLIAIGVCVTGFMRFVGTAKYRVGCFREIRTGKVVWQLTVSEYYIQNREMVDTLDGIFYGLCLRLGCPVIVFITTTITAIKLQQIIRWRHRSSSSFLSKETGVTKMLIWLSVEFFILSLPNIMLTISPKFDPRLNIGGQYENTFQLLINCGDVCTYMSSSVNFFVYYFTGSKYRETLHRLLNGLFSAVTRATRKQNKEEE